MFEKLSEWLQYLPVVLAGLRYLFPTEKSFSRRKRYRDFHFKCGKLEVRSIKKDDE